MKREFRAIAYGRVQMVNYRHFTRDQAKKFNIVGSVANLSSGAVEVVAVGEEKDLEQFIAKLERGPFFAHVRELRISWSPEVLGKFDSFIILDEV